MFENRVAPEGQQRASTRRAVIIWIVEVLVIVALASVVRAVHLGHSPDVDELNHVLAGRSLIETGEPRIPGGGLYTRSYLFTWLVARAMAIFGPGLVVARLPAVFAGVALVLAVFLWLRSVSGRPAAWTASLLLCFSPIAIYTSQTSRFYGLYALLVWGAIVGAYRLSRPGSTRSSRILAGILIVGCLALALHLQILALIPIVGLTLWLGLALVWEQRAFVRRHLRILLPLLLVAAIAGSAVLVASGFLARVQQLASVVPPWAETHAHDWRFYHRLLQQQYAVLWALFPAAALLALAHRPRAASLLLVMFGVALLLQSAATWKEERYFFHAMPPFFAVVGLAVGGAWRPLRDALAGLLLRAWNWSRGVQAPGEPDPSANRHLRRAASVILVLVGLFGLTGNTAYGIGRRMLIRDDAEFFLAAGHIGEVYRGEPDWSEAMKTLAPIVDTVDVVVGSSDLKTLFYTGRLDYELHHSHILTEGNGEEFSYSSKLGRPIVSTAASMERIVACHPSGIVIAERHLWGWSGGVPRETVDYIESHMRKIDIPGVPSLLAFTWSTPPAELSRACPPDPTG